MTANSPANRQVIREKTEARLRQIAGGTAGALGFAALDLQSGERFGQHENLDFPQASAIKIPVLLEVFQQAQAGELDLGAACRIEKVHKTDGSGFLKELGNGTVMMSLRDLCVLMILVSDNTATNLLIDRVGMERVNQTMAGLGLTHTRLRRRMMDQAAGERGDENLSTPAEAVRLLELLYRGEFVSREVSRSILEILRLPKSSAITAGLPPGTPVAGKPGAIGGVNVEWALVLAPERPYALAIMENYGSKGEATEAFREISRVLYDYFQRVGRATPHGSYSTPR